MLFAPLQGWRHVEVTDRHTAIDYAQILQDLSDTYFPKVAKIVLVRTILAPLNRAGFAGGSDP